MRSQWSSMRMNISTSLFSRDTEFLCSFPWLLFIYVPVILMPSMFCCFCVPLYVCIIPHFYGHFLYFSVSLFLCVAIFVLIWFLCIYFVVKEILYCIISRNSVLFIKSNLCLCSCLNVKFVFLLRPYMFIRDETKNKKMHNHYTTIAVTHGI